MTRRSFVILAIFFLFVEISLSQPSAKWENFTDLKNIVSIAVDRNTSNVYCASNGGLFVVDFTSGMVITKYTNLNGLIINDLTALRIDNNQRLWVGARDGSISILNLQSLTWKYIFDIKNSTETNKTINYLFPYNNLMLVATSYGIQKISTNNFNFIDAPYYKLGSFPINIPVYSLTVNNNILFAATKSGMAYANVVTSNLNDPTSWTNYNVSPLNSEVTTIETFDNKVFAGSNSGLNYYNGTSWIAYPNPAISNQNIRFIKSTGEKIYFVSNNTIFYANRNDLSNLNTFETPNNYTTLDFDNNNDPIAGLSDNGIMVKIGGIYSFVFPNSPYTNSFNQITIDDDDNIWAAGGTGSTGFYKFDGKEWLNYNTSTHPAIGRSSWFQKIVYGNGTLWALGFGGGPTLIRGSVIQNFNTTNSSLPGIPGDPSFTPCYGGVYDNNRIFWLTLFATNSSKSLYAFLPNNEWFGFTNPSIVSSAIFSEIAVDSYNTKWIATGGARTGVYFFNENGSLTNIADDIFGLYDLSDFGSEITNITDVIVDKNNEVWITTNNGIFIINNPAAAIQNPNQKPRPQKLGIISGNLKVPFTENCITITNDILNDKWIGTETNGVFHLSSDGSTLIEQLNTSKSPILSNKINSIVVSNRTGRAYFGTYNGLSSYSTDAIEPVADFEKLIASPNPYLIPSDVGLKIDGLIENSIIKIITLNGEVMNVFDSPGGRIALWDGRTNNNELAPTGIYIIVAYNKDGSKVGTGKVAIVRK